MSYQSERDRFIAFMAQHGHSADVSRKLLSMSATHGRLAVASCNGDWPADNGERKTKECQNCGSHWAPSSFKKGVCPDCRIEQRIQAHAISNGYRIEFQGDPRGYTVKVLYTGSDNVQRDYGVPQRS